MKENWKYRSAAVPLPAFGLFSACAAVSFIVPGAFWNTARQGITRGSSPVQKRHRTTTMGRAVAAKDMWAVRPRIRPMCPLPRIRPMCPLPKICPVLAVESSRLSVVLVCAWVNGQFQALFSMPESSEELFQQKIPTFGSYAYTKMADKLGLGTNCVFGVHDRETLKDEHAEANIH